MDVTRRPEDWRRRPREEIVIPFPRPEVGLWRERARWEGGGGKRVRMVECGAVI
jgi:hypothetical protein